MSKRLIDLRHKHMTFAHAAMHDIVIYMSGKTSHLPKARLGAIEREVLQELTFGDLLFGFLLSARSTRRFYKLARERATYRYRRKLAVERLEESGFIRSRGGRLSITKAGRGALGEIIGITRSFLDTKKWDGKWRIIAFDIPEKFAKLRNNIRDVLKKAGFAKLQQSIWIFPHECEDFAQLLKEESQLSRYILYGVLDRIEDEGRLKRLFKLSR
ncbi:MAG: Phenylacetic acid-responsive transcriptional repressor [Candidatus Kaiserbacteria bacterium GW2011_GWB1_52_6]|uniref:Phenylacetic acid-responsive transcriptional repressor n=1 Tax=Candidatus Kaiserbacteria bacterium GW2011_GWB1_52_6 TaxID=1618674 RepID=A0A0G1X7X6_9BACT|nr:MAG: Phenylacetic acid-responsive transcriptional repressor [Candidatus Kaiserbacteria bacterium GW2011_GWB1_52_6]